MNGNVEITRIHSVYARWAGSVYRSLGRMTERGYHCWHPLLFRARTTSDSCAHPVCAWGDRRMSYLWSRALILSLGFGLAFGLHAASSGSAPPELLHYSPNHNFDGAGMYTPASAGFNVADVDEPRRLNALPDGVKALVWVGMCDGVTPQFLARVRPFIGDQRVFGFFLMDDPDPRPQVGGLGPVPCEADKLRAESDWLHAHMSGTRTFAILMNFGTWRQPFYGETYRPEASHIDLFGICPYPCRSEWNGCDFDQVERYVAAAEAGGVPRSQIVPNYQAFGGGQWRVGENGRYVMPTPAQAEEIIRRWDALVPHPVFDMVYSWGSQRGDYALEDDTALQRLFATRNRQGRKQ
jgi:hypothetical protein